MRLGNLKLIERWLEKKYAAANPLDYNEKAILAECLAAVKNTPTIGVEPVRHGRWVEDCCYNTCSLCGNYFDRYDDGGYYQDFDYCPKCGAKMDLKE